jgi:flagellar hook assembly protein FlgD
VSFGARLSSAAAWVVTVRDAAGATVARGTGSSTAVAWTWDSTGAAPGRYTWTIEAGPKTRPAQGAIGSLPPPSAPILSGLTLDPAVISPDGDGIADSLTVSYTLAARTAVTATITDTTGAVVATLFSDQLQGARVQSFPYAAGGLPDGAYVLSISAAGEDGRTGRLDASFAIDRTLSGVSLTTQLLTPNGDGVDDTLGLGFTLASAANVTVQIEQAGAAVASVSAGELPAGVNQLVWDGSTPGGPAPDGSYEAVVIVDGPFGATRRAVPFAVSH